MRQYALTGLLNQILYWFLLHSNGVHFGSISIDCAIYIGSHLATRLFQSIHTNPSFTHHTSQLPVPNPSLNSALGSPISYHTYVTRHFPKFLPSSRSRSRSRSSSAEPRHSWDSSTPCACALAADRVFLFPTRQGNPLHLAPAIGSRRRNKTWIKLVQDSRLFPMQAGDVTALGRLRVPSICVCFRWSGAGVACLGRLGGSNERASVCVCILQ